LIALRQNDFSFVDVCEILLRYYKPVPDRLRPTDRMVAHTGYLIFGRPVLPSRPPVGLVPVEQEQEEVEEEFFEL
jgi:tRNA (adenine57-N1/adenine58-N1)-methyltransferase